MQKEIEQRIRDHVAMFNARDWDKYKAALDRECVYEEEATHRQVVGPERIVELLKAWTTAFPDLKGTVKELFVAGEKAVLEIAWKGTQKGALALPFMTIPPTGRSGEVHAMEKVEVDKSGHILRIEHYFDAMSLFAQLGMLPQLGPQPSQR